MTAEMIYEQLMHHHLDEDLMQELVIKIWNNRDTYRGDSSLGAWIGSIVRNHLIDTSRKKTTKQNNLTNPLSHYEKEMNDGSVISTIESYLISNELSPDQELIYKEDNEMLSKAIETLPGIHSRILIAYLNGTYDGTNNLQRTHFKRAKKALKNLRVKHSFELKHTPTGTIKRAKKALKNLKLKHSLELKHIPTGTIYSLYTAKEAAGIVGCSLQTIHNGIKSGNLFGKKMWSITKKG